MSKPPAPPVSGRINLYDAASGRTITVANIVRPDAAWKKLLTPEQYEITVRAGTERPGTHTFDEIKADGVYQCVRCGTDLYSSKTKFESGTGWPSFYQPISELNVRYRPDHSLLVPRTEVLCARCGSHLGHVFDDGPPPTGKRYCMNGLALKFVKKEIK